ncbi:hypothetical protein [Rhodococcoides fascians]|uniref:hypothetical protein n=1 Tax=Rhodococcoides fascians TaxID=1828 RepID=UPI00056A68B3|nr:MULTISPECIES: hypothetical protein [Rhodococcus]OZF05565.1 hypothetical protein CH301_04030 [Rhodococcus sp. 15-1189-1-1a]OZF20349.1 hypothetical protein CH299_04575 [Rhodococcus sp. 14-2686-1-2]
MNLAQTRAEIIDSLEQAGLRVQGWEVKQAVPPIAIVVPAVPHIETQVDGVSHGKPFMTNWLIQLVAGRGTAETVRTALDDMVTKAVFALEPGMVGIQVNSPLFEQGDNPNLGAEITASIAISMKED